MKSFAKRSSVSDVEEADIRFRRGGSSLVPKETAGFIDGDFVQMFLDADDADAQRILNGATQPERVAKLVGETKKDASDEDVVRVLEAAGGLH